LISKQAAHGFTLIELVVVIVILGILAAVALPRFVTFAREARIAKLEAARGAVGIGAFQANTLSLTHGLAPNALVTMEGATVTMSLSYPTADAAGIVVAAGLSPQDYSVLNLPSAPPNSVAIAAPGGGDVTQCYFLYVSPAAQGDPPDFATVVTAGC
jgi:MSHA pilin protein MshA